MRFTPSFASYSKTPRRTFSQRPKIEILEDRCLLSDFSLGSLVQIDPNDPFAGCTADNPPQQSGQLFPNTQVESQVAVDPNDPNHIVAVWQQDRWSNGGSRGLVSAVSFDGGQSWQEVVLPGLSKCSGGAFDRASDPWVSFDPSGNLYSISLSLNDGPGTGVLVNQSTDGGLTWSDPIALINDFQGQGFNDKESITADPTDSNYAYAVWDRIGSGRPEMFSRTTDGGQTWEPARAIYNNGSAVCSIILVLPDGTVADVFGSVNNQGLSLYAGRSEDKGATWDPPVQVASLNAVGIRDPNNGQGIRSGNGIVFDAAVDPNSGSLYAVWEDGRFTGFRFDHIAFTSSNDGGFTWSTPVQVNQTPTNIPAADQQAFDPSVQVAADGTVAVTYYDFRNHGSNHNLPTDHWFVSGVPNDSGGIDWGNEYQLTDQSFDMELAPNAGGYFVGDYTGLGANGTTFMSTFGQTIDSSQTGIFFRSLSEVGTAPGRGTNPPAGGGTNVGTTASWSTLLQPFSIDTLGTRFFPNRDREDSWWAFTQFLTMES